jgi:hypothetical protein
MKRKEQPVERVLKVGSREIVVEATPNRGRALPKSLHRPNDRLLILKPSAIQSVLDVALFVWVLVFCWQFYVLVGRWDPTWDWYRHVGVVALVIFGVFTFGVALRVAWVMIRSYEFDLDSGHMRARSLKGQWERPLTDVLAVQIIRELRSGYELNLVLDDESRRLTLARYAHLGPRLTWSFFREQGAALATFLGVPLLEEDELDGLI